MDIYQFAMRMERDGEMFYRQLAQECPEPGLAGIFTMLAEEEVKHYRVISRLSKKEKEPLPSESAILRDVKNVFIAMQAEKIELRIDTTKAAIAYRKACDLEDQSQQFYVQKAEVVADAHERQIFLRLAKEEEKHLRIMENIVEFVTRREPGNWLENAEWHHLDEY